MPLRLARNRLHLDGDCGVEEALVLLEHLAGAKPPRVDMRRCTHLHTALLQVLAACRPRHLVPPEDDFLARWVMPLVADRPGTS
jgi:hypothetical protein